MASNTSTSSGNPKLASRAGAKSSPGLPPSVRAILTPFASLRLTVFLLVTAVLVTWIATLDQAAIDIWELKDKHFSHWRVFVPFQTFFVPAWFPNFQSVPFGFWIPSGFTIIVAMLVNLICAHILRFRLQASGGRLAIGVLVGVLTAIFTWAIIFSGSEQRSFQAQPPISYRTMWTWMQVAVLGLSIAAIARCCSRGKLPWVEKSIYGFFGLIGASLLAVTLYWGEEAFIGDSAMRILWQLMLSTLAASIGLVACNLIFRRKAGIVLLHLGIAGLLINEIYVTTTNEEQQMLIEEGQVTSVAVDIREPEFVVFDRSGTDTDRIISIPSSQLSEKAGSRERITHSELPFEVEVVEYFSNSDFNRGAAGPDSELRGIGSSFKLSQLPPVPGTDSKSRNFAGAFVRLFGKEQGKPLGMYMLNQTIYMNDFVDTIEVEGKKYQIGLRDKEIYKPYSITLKDVQREDYIGTETPKWFASKINFTDHEANVSSDQLIWMNNPMRYAGETFYQQSYIPSDNEHKERTVIQIVKNRGWMIPYVCCMFTVVGLAFQFGTTLLAYLRKNQARTERVEKVIRVSSEPPKRNIRGWIPAMFFVGVFAVYCLGDLSKAVRPSKSDEMRLDLFGQIPVTYEGRVKPLDSLARNFARQLCNREEVGYRTNIMRPKFFGLYSSAETKPAIRWFADTVFKVDGFDKDYETLRIEDPTVQRALDLPRRKSMDYTLNELEAARPKLGELIAGFGKKDPKTWTNFEKRIAEVSSKLNRIVEMQVAFSNPESWGETSILNRLNRAELVAKAPGLPRSFPTGDENQPWEVWANLKNQNWIRSLAKEYNTTEPTELARKLIDVDVVKELKNEMLFNAMKLELIKKGKKKSDVDLLLKANDDKFPQAVYDELLPLVEPAIDQKIASGRVGPDAATFAQIQQLMGAGKIDTEPVGAEFVSLLSELEPAYFAGDVDRFNSAITTYMEKLNANPPESFVPSRNRLEYVFNEFSTFYLAMVMYLVGFLLSLVAFVGFSKPLNRAGFGLVALGLTLQVVGLVVRVIVSERPPVTNLYSSFLFVSAFGVLIMLLIERFTRIGIGTVLGSTVGFLALLTAWSISVQEGDTFTVLRAVLDTQFWLSTHVLCIALGYSTTVVAGFLGMAYVLIGVTTNKFDQQISKKIGEVIYGIVCFGLLFSFFGTVLGGLWADDSWGRFWGWDPKENGALMIVLWNAVVLHARWAGLVKIRGMAILAIIGNIVTIWSWEAVNQLGIGLHAYGFSEGRMKSVALFWLVNLCFVVVGMLPTKYWRSKGV